MIGCFCSMGVSPMFGLILGETCSDTFFDKNVCVVENAFFWAEGPAVCLAQVEGLGREPNQEI